jgi:hypothetical protein
MLRRDFLKTAMATTVLTAVLPASAKKTPADSIGRFADVNGQHVFYTVHGAGKPLILLHGGINPDSFGSNLAELAKGRQVIAPISRHMGARQTLTGHCAVKRWVTTLLH